MSKGPRERTGPGVDMDAEELFRATKLLNEQADKLGSDDLDQLVREEVPSIAAQLVSDGQNPELLSLWGLSSNYDASDGETPIVHPKLLAALGRIAEVDLSGDPVHAGLMHTYGYLLSNLETPFGFKRKRYVQPDVAQGLGLPEGALDPCPSDGTLLANLCYVASRFALEKSGLEFAQKIGASVSLAECVPTSGEQVCLLETIEEAGGHPLDTEVILRTDFIRFGIEGEGKENSWLVYSVWQSGEGKLITAFPAAGWMAKKLVKKGNKNGVQEISPRYNARLGGLDNMRLSGTARLLSP